MHRTANTSNKGAGYMFRSDKITIIALCSVIALLLTALVGPYLVTLPYHDEVTMVEPLAGVQIEDPATTPAIDTDMCGESLIGKALPHAMFPGFTQLVLDAAHQPSIQGMAPEIPVPDGYLTKDVTEYVYTTYNYALHNVWYSTRDFAGKIWFSPCNNGSEVNNLNAVYAEAERIIQELGIDENTRQRDAIVRINNYVCENMSYQNDDTKVVRDAYASFFMDTGVCYNYTVQFQVLCLTAGIECHYIISDDGTHCWNQVFFSDGSYCWIDVCWNDNVAKNATGEWTEVSVANGFTANFVAARRGRFLFMDDLQNEEAHAEYGHHMPKEYSFAFKYYDIAY